MALQPVTFSEFNGGLTDLYVGTDTTRAAALNNLLIDETKKPYVRFGTTIFPTRLPTIISVQKPTGVYIGPQPFSHPVSIVESHAYIVNESGGFTEVIGPNNAFLPSKTGSVYESALIWRRQLIAAAPVKGLPPSMIYCTNYVQPASVANPAAYAARTLGMPALASSPSINYTSTDATQYLYAFYYKYTFVDYTGTLFAFFGNPNVPGLVNASNGSTPVDNSHTQAISAIPALANAGLSNYDVSSSVTTNTTYTKGSVTATVASATGIVLGAQLINTVNALQGTCVVAINGTTITLSQPALATNAAASTVFSSLTIQIYRTINGGSVFFFDGMVANGTTTFTDGIPDATLQIQQVIYTSGGALGYDQPPTNVVALTQTNDFWWYATTTSLYQSIQGAPGACPSSFADQIDQRIVGLSDVISFPILFCDRSVYRVEGTFDSFGNNGFVLREISKTAGCVSNNSIVKTPYGLVWFGNGGVFYTDGYNVKKITNHLNISYQVWANANACGEYDPTRNMVYWTINTTKSQLRTNNAWLILHLTYGIKDESVFSTSSSENNFSPTALRFSQASDILNSDPVASPGLYSQFYGRMLFADQNQYLLWFDPQSLADVAINVNTSPSQMAKNTIMYEFITAGLDQGTTGLRKYTPDISLEVDSSTPVAIQIRNRRDDGGGGWSGEGGSPPTGKGVAGSPGGGSSGNPGAPEIRQDGAITWGITDCTWMSDANEFLWNDFPTVSGKRSIPAGQIRSGRRQFKFTNAYTVITGSDLLGTGTVTVQSGMTMPFITLDTYPTKIWLTDPEGYWITFVGDNYNQTYKIIARTSDSVLTIADPYGTLVAGSQKWEIKGYRKFERPRILNFTLYAEAEGSTYGQATQSVGANV